MTKDANQKKRAPHLSDFFTSGREVVLNILNPEDPDNPIRVEMWMAKVRPDYREQALLKGRAKQSRLRILLKDEDSDEHMAVVNSVETLPNVEELVEALMAFEDQDIHSTAYNEVLYSDDIGSDWGSDGSAYVDLMNAIQDRFAEIDEHNEALSDEDSHLRINLGEDRELQLLRAEEEKFESEVEARKEYLKKQKRDELRGHKVQTLRDMLFDKLIESETGVAFLQEYRLHMLFYSCRYTDNHSKFYFGSPGDVWDLPEYVRNRLFTEWEEVNRGVDDIKNLLTPQGS